MRYTWLQLVETGNQEVSQLAAGDSILMPLNAAICVASDSAACNGDTWHMATLRLFIDIQRLSNAPVIAAAGVTEMPSPTSATTLKIASTYQEPFFDQLEIVAGKAPVGH